MDEEISRTVPVFCGWVPWCIFVQQQLQMRKEY